LARNVPAAAWNWRPGGCRVLRKWLSCRERDILDRPLRAKEIRHFTDTARRITAIPASCSGAPSRNDE